MTNPDPRMAYTEDAPQQTGLGRRYAPDPRDRRFALTEARMAEIPRQLEPGARRRKFPWRLHGDVPLNQGGSDACTVYTAMHQLMAAPRLRPFTFFKFEPLALLAQAKAADEWPGENYEGTSERAVLKLLQSAGLIGEYLWVTDEEIAKEYLMTRGCLSFGSDWFRSMDTPGKDAIVEPVGPVRGGHEYLLRWWYNTTHKKYPDTYEFVNSWGPGYGEKGVFRMKAESFRYLFLHLNGDLVSPLEATK